mgnify:FL=1
MEEELLLEIKEKRPGAWEHLLSCYGSLIKGIVSYHLRAFPSYQEDCMQEILLGIWQNINRFDPHKNTLKNWIGAICKYKCIDFRRKYFHELSSKELTEDLVAPEQNKELQADISELLSQLSPADRELFYRHYILGESIEDYAQTKPHSSAFFYNRLSRGRKKLKTYFKGGNFYEK